eukprot:TRINITY_DN9743_c0_g2_i12.p1 TRINITY_DN9743_c0_g2~~TRINITY_DN9743_c0_g2_i12.p1  ORF type:complete len:271 (-),score=8.35 TRINITY_DN9743_c0_g2_i12:1631-2362(-)
MSMGLISIFVLLIKGYSFDNFYTFGDKLLYKNEGSKVTSISGYKSVIDISSLECAQGCLAMKQACNCCNSITYNTFRRECYLKLKPQDSSDEVAHNNDGFQTYTFENNPGSFLVENVKSLQDSFLLPRGRAHSYIHYGMNQLAINEGNKLQTVDNKAFLSRVTPDDCAEECNRIPNCNSFSFSPNKDGGACYMKQSLDESRGVTYSSTGWRTYWKDTVDKCFCTCKTNVFCVICERNNFCYER